jgi:DNA ligase D-like protein (predicted ligase)
MSRVSALAFIEPQLPTLTDHAPEGAEWIHEVKHDGYRTLLTVEHRNVVAYTRNGFDWTDRYPSIVAAAAKLSCKTAILDGEIIVQDASGASDFDELQRTIKSRASDLLFYAFDLLHLNGQDLRNRPLTERRSLLKKLIGNGLASPLQFSDEYIGDASSLFRACAERGLEGIVSKIASSRYQSGRSSTWLKTKCFTESVLTLVGIDRDRKTRAPMALLARSESGELDYVGAAFLALPNNAQEFLSAKLDELATDSPSIRGLRNRDARWVKPLLVVKVRHLTGPKLLRHATVREIFSP